MRPAYAHKLDMPGLEVLGEAAAAKAAKVPLSNDTNARRTADLADNMEIQLVNQIKLANTILYS